MGLAGVEDWARQADDGQIARPQGLGLGASPGEGRTAAWAWPWQMDTDILILQALRIVKCLHAFTDGVVRFDGFPRSWGYVFGAVWKNTGRFHRSMIHVDLVRNLGFARASYNGEGTNKVLKCLDVLAKLVTLSYKFVIDMRQFVYKIT